MGATVGIHFIWTTYGTWLPGDPSKPGHWSPLFDLYGRMRQAGHRLNLPDAATYSRARANMNEAPKYLDEEEQRIVAGVFQRHLAPGLPGETVITHALAIESTHVHLLTGPLREDVGRFVGRLKGTSSSELIRHPNNWERRRIWTAGFWKVFLFDDGAVDAVRGYIDAHNERHGRGIRPYSWIGGFK